jgi:predicted HD phosphohydrolase
MFIRSLIITSIVVALISVTNFAGAQSDTTEYERELLAAYQKDTTTFQANYKMGGYYYNRGVVSYNEVTNTESYKLFMVGRNKMRADFRKAMPYLEKAFELKSYDRYTIRALKRVYVELLQSEKYEALKEKLK